MNMSHAVMVGVASGSVGGIVWLLLSVPRPLTWHRPPGRWSRGLGQAVQGIRRRLSPTVRRQADVLAWTPRQLFWQSVAMAGVLGTILMVWQGVVVGLGVAVAGFYVAPAVLVRRRFHHYQEALAAAFETHVLLLRIYFDLGMPLLTALRQMRAALRGPAHTELDRLLGELVQGPTTHALRAWADRTQLMEYRMLADTLMQQQGEALRGEALAPLDTLLTAQRTQTMKNRTDKLTSGAAIVPILATVAITLLYLYGLMVHIPGVHALHFHW